MDENRPVVIVFPKWGIFTEKLPSLEWTYYCFVSAVQRWMPIGQISGAVCKMYVRRSVNSKRLCTHGGQPIIISGVLLVLLVYFQIGAIGGCLCRSDQSPLHVLIRESLSREIG